MINSKRGMISEAIVFAISIITFFITAFIFLMILNIPSCSKQTITKTITSTESIKPLSDYSMTVLMRIPVVADVNNDGLNETMDFSDLLVYCANKKDFSLAEPRIDKFFENTNYYFLISVNENDQNGLKEIAKFRRKGLVREGKYNYGEITLPNYQEGSGDIIIKYSIATGVEPETQAYPMPPV